MKHDYEGALRAFTGDGGVLHMEDVEAIEYALKLAVKILGEPSVGMLRAGYNGGEVTPPRTIKMYREMINQAQMEIEE